ncbi:MAG: flagellar biosynthesis anti-sigma factor FlgM [Phycisphaeraceae bacterium]
MSDISPIGRPGPAALGRAGKTPPRVPEATEQARGRDHVELSRTAQLLSKIHELPDVRQDVVERVRAEIESGRYDTPGRLETALQRLMEEEGLA